MKLDTKKRILLAVVMVAMGIACWMMIVASGCQTGEERKGAVQPNGWPDKRTQHVLDMRVNDKAAIKRKTKTMYDSMKAQGLEVYRGEDVDFDALFRTGSFDEALKEAKAKKAKKQKPKLTGGQ